MKYREDINGLRALAVISVVLFHFDASWLPGGFSGVDVFFVISGFLMTGIIFNGLQVNNFSIVRFYVARANRIIPALCFLCFSLFILSWLFLTPLDFKIINKHIVSSLGFFSNILYWKEVGYFDANADEKWLLHTWSLSVEWQFYLLYPLIIVFLRKLISLKAIKLVILISAILGFFFAAVLTYLKPDPAYYLFPTRAWEMMFGGVAYLFPFSIREHKKRWLEVSGLILILSSYLFISKETPWPGYMALLPVLGTFFIIQAERKNSFLTSNSVFKYLGTWSYSIYLWHWPLVVGLNYFSLPRFFIYIAIPLSILLGYLSYKYIESIKFKSNSFYTPSLVKFKPINFALIGILLSSIGFYGTSYFYNLPKFIFDSVVISPAMNGNSQYTWKLVNELNTKLEFKEVKYKVLTIGDSQSGDFINSLYSAGLSQDVDIVSRIVKMRCEVFYLDKKELKESFKNNKNIKNGYVSESVCEQQIQRIKESKAVKNANIIIISMLWKDKNMPYIIKSIENIRNKNKNAIIYIVGGKSFNTAIPKLIYEAYLDDLDVEFLASQRVANNNEIKLAYQAELFNQNKDRFDIRYIDLMESICTVKNCPLLVNNKPIYSDDTHFTKSGAQYIGVEIKKLNLFPEGFYSKQKHSIPNENSDPPPPLN